MRSKGCGCVGLTTLPPLRTDCVEILRASTSRPMWRGGGGGGFREP